jgi:hydroxyacylglutathione hydrolase
MILKRFYDEPLAHASYLVGCPGAGEAIVIDPNRDLDKYLEVAAAEGVRITAVTETHIHADYASGALELAQRTGATLYVSDEGGPDWLYAFTDLPFVTPVKEGDQIRLGKIRLDVLHTPGHTPEHLSFILTDEAVHPDPVAAFTGDFLFVGDVGRPDLLERAAGIEGTMESGARVLFESLQKIKRYPEFMTIWPAHGAGSPCGKSLGGVPATSLGYEMRSNWALLAQDEDRFVQDVLAGQPEPPRYYAEMKRLNKQGAASVGSLGAPVRLAQGDFEAALSPEVTLLDVRSVEAVTLAAAPGALHLPIGKSFTIYAGWLVSYQKPIYLIAANAADAAQAKRQLATIGLDHVKGWFGPEVLQGRTVPTPQITAPQLAERLAKEEVNVLDVRNPSETSLGMIPGASAIPLSVLESRIQEVSTEKPLVVQCGSGLRSMMAISLLRKHGITNVTNLMGGYTAYRSIAEGLTSLSASACSTR